MCNIAFSYDIYIIFIFIFLKIIFMYSVQIFWMYVPLKCLLIFLSLILIVLSQYNPMKVWLYRGGFARFSNTRFSLDSIEDNCIFKKKYKVMQENLLFCFISYICILILIIQCQKKCQNTFLTSDTDIHLTNVAIQKTAPDYDPEKGCKWSTQQLRMYLCAKHGTNLVS